MLGSNKAVTGPARRGIAAGPSVARPVSRRFRGSGSARPSPVTQNAQAAPPASSRLVIAWAMTLQYTASGYGFGDDCLRLYDLKLWNGSAKRRAASAAGRLGLHLLQGLNSIADQITLLTEYSQNSLKIHRHSVLDGSRRTFSRFASFRSNGLSDERYSLIIRASKKRG